MSPRPRELYKYFSHQRTDVLANGKLRFAAVKAQNDLFEGSPVVAGLASPEEIACRYREALLEKVEETYEELGPEARAKMPKRNYIDAMMSLMPANETHFVEKMRDLMDPIVKRVFGKLGEIVGICCFSEVGDHVLMWAHYAQSNQGFAIQFDPEHEYFDSRRTAEDEFGVLRRVVYQEHRPNKPMKDLDGLDLFFVKGIAWQSEKEWRILQPLTNAQLATVDEARFVDFPRAAVKSVILGARCTEPHESLIRNAIEQGPLQGVPVRMAKASATGYSIDIG